MKDVVSGTVALIFGIGAAVMSWSLQVGHPSRPSPGFFPFIASVGIAAFGLFILIDGLRKRHAPAVDAAWRWSWPAVACIAALVFYAQVMDFLGFAISTFLLMTTLFKLAGMRSWLSAAGLAVAMAAAAEFVFKGLLKMTLPGGPFGF